MLTRRLSPRPPTDRRQTKSFKNMRMVRNVKTNLFKTSGSVSNYGLGTPFRVKHKQTQANKEKDTVKPKNKERNYKTGVLAK